MLPGLDPLFQPQNQQKGLFDKPETINAMLETALMAADSIRDGLIFSAMIKANVTTATLNGVTYTAQMQKGYDRPQQPRYERQQPQQQPQPQQPQQQQPPQTAPRVDATPEEVKAPKRAKVSKTPKIGRNQA